jgi:hypothetical protein
LSQDPDGQWPVSKWFETSRRSAGRGVPADTKPRLGRPVPDLPDIDVRVDSALVRFKSAPPVDRASLDCRLGDGGLRGEVRGRMLSGDLSGRFSGPAGLGVMDVAGNLAGVDLADLQRYLPGQNVKLSGRADLQADLKRVSGNLNTMSGTVSLTGASVGIAGLPTFSSLTQTLNDIAETLDGLRVGGSLKDIIGRAERSSRSLVTEQGTTRFDGVSAEAQISDGIVRLDRAVFHNQEIRIESAGSVGLENGALDIKAVVAFQEAGLQKIESKLARDVLSKGFSLPVRGTLTDPDFDKRAALKPFLREAGKILQEKLGGLIRRKKS